jgi:hypothetical protein
MDQAARYAAQAYLILAQLGAWEQEQVAKLLVDLLGSVEAANAYLAEIQEQEEQPPS